MSKINRSIIQDAIRSATDPDWLHSIADHPDESLTFHVATNPHIKRETAEKLFLKHPKQIIKNAGVHSGFHPANDKLDVFGQSIYSRYSNVSRLPNYHPLPDGVETLPSWGHDFIHDLVKETAKDVGNVGGQTVLRNHLKTDSDDKLILPAGESGGSRIYKLSASSSNLIDAYDYHLNSLVKSYYGGRLFEKQPPEFHDFTAHADSSHRLYANSKFDDVMTDIYRIHNGRRNIGQVPTVIQSIALSSRNPEVLSHMARTIEPHYNHQLNTVLQATTSDYYPAIISDIGRHAPLLGVVATNKYLPDEDRALAINKIRKFARENPNLNPWTRKADHYLSIKAGDPYNKRIKLWTQ